MTEQESERLAQSTLLGLMAAALFCLLAVIVIAS